MDAGNRRRRKIYGMSREYSPSNGWPSRLAFTVVSQMPISIREYSSEHGKVDIEHRQ